MIRPASGRSWLPSATTRRHAMRLNVLTAADLLEQGDDRPLLTRAVVHVLESVVQVHACAPVTLGGEACSTRRHHRRVCEEEVVTGRKSAQHSGGRRSFRLNSSQLRVSLRWCLLWILSADVFGWERAEAGSRGRICTQGTQGTHGTRVVSVLRHSGPRFGRRGKPAKRGHEEFERSDDAGGAVRAILDEDNLRNLRAPALPWASTVRQRPSVRDPLIYTTDLHKLPAVCVTHQQHSGARRSVSARVCVSRSVHLRAGVRRGSHATWADRQTAASVECASSFGKGREGEGSICGKNLS